MATRTTSARAFRSSRLLLGATSLRIALAPVVMALVLSGGDTADAVAAGAVRAGRGHRLLDGYLARRWKVTSKLGSFLDTTADKLLVTVVLMALVAVGRASPWLAAVDRRPRDRHPRPARRRRRRRHRLRALARRQGQGHGAVRGASLLAILRPGDKIGPAYLDQWAMLAAAVVTIATGIDYFLRYSAALRRGA